MKTKDLIKAVLKGWLFILAIVWAVYYYDKLFEYINLLDDFKEYIEKTKEDEST